jgi:hypothetical protein
MPTLVLTPAEAQTIRSAMEREIARIDVALRRPGLRAATEGGFRADLARLQRALPRIQAAASAVEV